VDCCKDAFHVAAGRPALPVFCRRPHAAERAARWFLNTFPGDVFYAVKANPSPWLLRALYAAGVRCFDVASLAEARLVRQLFPNATLGFMHPIKSAAAIAEAYAALGVRVFALDSEAELDKILAATHGADDLTLCVRLAVPSDGAIHSLARKFGVAGEDAVALVRRTRLAARRFGISFHVGSQAMTPAAYSRALDLAESVIVKSGVIVDVIDVGGGFPSIYPGMTPPPLSVFVHEIAGRFERMLVSETCALWCEPGRALAAEAASLVVRVEGRKGDHLYVNDGAFGALFDAAALGWPFPVRALADGAAQKPLRPFRLFGPTCDDMDLMEGPFHLPHDIALGDYVEIGMLGAYGEAMRTSFNGYGEYDAVVVEDEPMASAYEPCADTAQESAHV